MLTLIIHFKVHKDKEKAFRAAAEAVVANTRQNDDCIEFTMLQNADDPTDFVLFERWQDAAKLDAHAARLKALREAGGEAAAALPGLSGFADSSSRGTYRVVA